MFELYKSELLRLRTGTLVALLGLIVVYFMLPRLGFWEVLHRNMGFLLTVGFIIMSLSFGIFHGILWRKKNYWIFLVHRPMESRNIYLSLLGAGVTVLCITILLSLTITTLFYDAVTDKVVDSRHYMFALYITLVSIACYMIGTLTVLHRSKFTVLVLYALGIVFFPEPQNALAQYLPLLFMLIALLYLNLQSFKPDLNKPLQSPLATGLLATGSSYGIVVCLIIATTLIYHLPLTMLGKHPDTNPEYGGMKYIFKDYFEDAVGYVLEHSEHPQADHYAAQSRLVKRKNIPIKPWSAPRKGQFHRFDNGDSLIDTRTGAIWKFSHDKMLLLGIDANTKKSIGAIGKRGFVDNINSATNEDQFDVVPHLSGERYLNTQYALYSVDFESGELILKHQTNDNEQYTSSLWVSGNEASISTNKRLLIFNVSTLMDDFSELVVDYEVEYPASVQRAEFGNALPVADGIILVFLGADYFGFDRPGSEVFITRLDGTFERLGGREFTVHDHPSWIRHYNFLIAPFVYVTEELIMHSIDPYDDHFLSAKKLREQKYPTEIYVIAILLQMMSLVVVWMLMKSSTIQSKLRWTWLGLTTMLGLPALLSYLLLQHNSKR